MAYGTTPDLFDKYIKIGEKMTALCLDNFCRCVFHLFALVYLRKPTADDIARLYNFHAKNMVYRNCHIAWQGQYTRGANSDINVLNYSPLFNTIKEGTAPPSPFNVNDHHYERGYYLCDGIYPDWAMLVKAPHNPIDEPRKKFKRFQESARKDIERDERMIAAPSNRPIRLERNLRDRDVRVKEIRDRQVHNQLESDLTEHVWNFSPYFRAANINIDD
ncbi:uncharacterized protein [Rutidosis leptorrhynchoides]|uniref:uncharacterized protein n=1 Tax=Rutidosis leptorrhynchoides TaxID=125765 RepID=UPI003A9A11DD